MLNFINRVISTIKKRLSRLNTLKLRMRIITILIIYFIIVLVTQILYGLLNFNDVLESNKNRDKTTIEVYLKQAALNLKMDIDRVEEISSLVYDESYFDLEEQKLTSNIQSGKRELNTIIDLIFKTNKDIPGITIYTQSGGMMSYSNPYSLYYYLSGSSSMYSDLLNNVKNKSNSLLLKRKYDNSSDGLLSIKFFQSQTNKDNYGIIVIEKNMGSMKQYFKDLGLLGKGSIVLITDSGDTLFLFSEDASDHRIENLLSSGKINNKFTDLSGVLEVDYDTKVEQVFYNKSIYSGCNLLYIVDSDQLNGYKTTTINFIIISSILLIIINILFIILFNKNVYIPIKNAEEALKEIVEGNTEYKIEGVNESSELSPLYNDLNSLTEKLKNLVKSEYTAKIMKKQAEIDALQSQINPHFLYNTLESIRGQAIEEGATSIEMMVKTLSDLFRYNISNKKAMVTLKDELENIDNYINIQQFRFNNKFKIIKEIQLETLNCMIPKLIVQPLVENAIKHGLETKIGKGIISIRAHILDSRLIINIEDDGQGMDQEELVYINKYLVNGVNLQETQNIKIGLGLININERIKLIYNTDFGIKIYSMKGVGTNVELSIPI